MKWKQRTILLLIGTLLTLQQSYAQYYFNDILSTNQSNEQYKLLRSQKIRVIKAASFEPDNTPTEGFALQQEISQDGKKIVITTTLNQLTSTTTSTYDQGKVKRTQTDNKGISSKTDYTYDAQGRVQKIQFLTSDTAMKSTLTEIHEWRYDEYGAPISMLKIKDGTDTTFITFIKDEQGDIGEEQWKRNGKLVENYFYYYNNKHQLTDIVKPNIKARKLLPEFLYDYDANGKLTQMTQYSLSSNNYFMWKYTYNEKGLKASEVCTDKSKAVVGRIVYNYTTSNELL